MIFAILATKSLDIYFFKRCAIRLQLELVHVHSNKVLLMSGNCLKGVLNLQCFSGKLLCKIFSAMCNVFWEGLAVQKCFLESFSCAKERMTLLKERIDMPPTWARLTPENLTAAAFKRNLYATKEFLVEGNNLTENSLSKQVWS